MKRVRALASWIGVLFLVGGGGAVAFALRDSSVVDAAQRIGLVTACLGLLGVGVKGVRSLIALGRPAVAAALGPQDVDALAAAIFTQWQAEGARRLLLSPAPLPLRWSCITAETGDPLAVGRFAPIPGLAPMAPRGIVRGGGLMELFALYGTLPSGRVVLTGRPGSGKSAAAVLLVLEALHYRAALRPEDAAKVPVPVLVTLAGWTPAVTSFESWFAQQLAALHLSGPTRVQQALELVRSGRVSALLDGLDEVPPEQRPLILEALGAAPVRVVVFTRTGEHAEAARRHRLLDAAVVELCPLDPATVVGYLGRAFPGTAPRGWAVFTSCLINAPNSELARALSNPLTVSLVRDTYGGDDDVTELLYVSAAADGQRAVTEMLLDRLVDVRYAARPGQPSASVTGSRARATLAWIAMRMNERGTRELAWWRISNWVSPWPYRFVVVLAVVTWLLAGLMSAQIVLGLSEYFVFDFEGLLIFAGPPAVFTVVVLLLMRRRERGGIHLLPRLRWRSAMRATAVAMANATLVGVVFILSLMLGYGVFEGDPLGPGDAEWLLTFGIVFGVGAMPVGIAWVLSHTEGDPTPLTPASAWQKSKREAQVVALLVALGVSLPFDFAWLWLWLPDDVWSAWLIFGALVLMGLELAVMLGVIRSPTTRANIAAAQLALSHHTPLRLMRFLEDAHERGVLRTVGPVYEFRHAGLQDRLAMWGKWESQSSTASARMSSSIPGWRPP